MQGDIMDEILRSVDAECHVVDPFVGSGTVMTESLLRSLDFTGIDINPLAVMVCEAKAAIDAGVNIAEAVEAVSSSISADTIRRVDVAFPRLSKWFEEDVAIELSKIRRAIIVLPNASARKVLWTAFAETIRLCSNSRTTTYKLHIRADGDRVAVRQVLPTFATMLEKLKAQVETYQLLVSSRTRCPLIDVVCSDVMKANVRSAPGKHTMLVTSPPYGDNHTTIPYGQYSYLALNWIPAGDVNAWVPGLATSAHSIDRASLGGSLKEAVAKTEKIRGISKCLDDILDTAVAEDRVAPMRKVAIFMSDFFDSLRHLRSMLDGPAHWVLTTGNRTAAGRLIPLDVICSEMLCHLGAEPIASIKRKLPNKRMPTKNSMGTMITSETTLVAEFV